MFGPDNIKTNMWVQIKGHISPVQIMSPYLDGFYFWRNDFSQNPNWQVYSNIEKIVSRDEPTPSISEPAPEVSPASKSNAWLVWTGADNRQRAVLKSEITFVYATTTETTEIFMRGEVVAETGISVPLAFAAVMEALK